MFETIDKKLFHPQRITMIYLMIIQKVNTFRGFKDYINNISDGNLISHLRALEQAGFIIIEKTIKNNKYRTLYKLSVTGDKKFKEMLEGMVIMANEAYNI